MNTIQSNLLYKSPKDLDNLSKENRKEIYDIFQNNLLFVKADVITDFINKNYTIKLYGLPNNEILKFLNQLYERIGYFRKECPFTFEKQNNQITNVIHLRIDENNQDIYLDFYTY